MKKIVALSLILLTFASKGLAQDSDRKGYVSINLGLSIPTGNYASKVYNNNRAGYATTGFVRDFSFGYQLHPKLGLLAIFRSQANGVDAGSQAQGFENELRATYPTMSPSVTMQSSVYSFGGMLAGAYGKLPISEKLSFEPRLLLGLAAPSLPSSTTETFSSGSKMSTFIQNETVAFAFAYNIGAGFKYEIGKKYFFLMNMDFYAAKATFENIEMVYIGHVTKDFEREYYYQTANYSTINMNAGFGFRF
jgi:hypothetical protein